VDTNLELTLRSIEQSFYGLKGSKRETWVRSSPKSIEGQIIK